VAVRTIMSEKEILEETDVKPLWLEPSLITLFDLLRLHRVRPWDVDISYILTTLVKEMKKRGSVDFVASGVALLSSSILYRMKSELVLKMQEPPKIVVKKQVDFIPPPIQLPYRHEYTTTTITDLIGMLEEALEKESKVRSNLIEIAPEPPINRGLDQFAVNVKKNMAKLYEKIVRLAKSEKNISFTKLVAGKRRIEIVRTFLLILLIACEGKVRLRQEKGLDEIYISLA